MTTTRVQGYGCMGLSGFYASAKSTTEEQAIAAMKHAYDRGVTIFNTATFYGPLNELGYGANLRLIGKFLKQVDRSKVFIVCKIGMDTRTSVENTGRVWNLKANYEFLDEDVNYALEQLGTDYIDCIVLCRISPVTPIEESVTAMKKIVDSGRARNIGISEASAETIRRAHATSPIYCIEQEWSMWSRDIEDEIIPTVKELGIKVIAYSPLGRGFLTGAFQDRSIAATDPHDFRFSHSPKFSEENFQNNLNLVNAVKAIAERRNVKTGQIALAWLYTKHPTVIPIPGTSNIKHMDDNIDAKDITLSEEEMNEIDNIFDPKNVKGDRYGPGTLTFAHNK